MKKFYSKIIVMDNSSMFSLRLSNVFVEEEQKSFTITQEGMSPKHKFTLKYSDFSWKPLSEKISY